MPLSHHRASQRQRLAARTRAQIDHRLARPRGTSGDDHLAALILYLDQALFEGGHRLDPGAFGQSDRIG